MSGDLHAYMDLLGDEEDAYEGPDAYAEGDDGPEDIEFEVDEDEDEDEEEDDDGDDDDEEDGVGTDADVESLLTGNTSLLFTLFMC